MAIKLSRDHNPFDELLERFLAEYRYELLASFGLLFLLGGIVLAVKMFDQQKSEPQVLPIGSPSPSATAKLFVEVAGAVATPGVYEVEESSRVEDLINLAGGLTKAADLAWVEQNLNRAQLLADGQKVYIPQKGQLQTKAAGEDGGQRVAGAQSRKINLNTASQTELETLPGIGPAYAERIIKARPFGSVEQLLKVSGIGVKRYEQIKEMVTVY